MQDVPQKMAVKQATLLNSATPPRFGIDWILHVVPSQCSARVDVRPV